MWGWMKRRIAPIRPTGTLLRWLLLKAWIAVCTMAVLAGSASVVPASAKDAATAATFRTAIEGSVSAALRADSGSSRLIKCALCDKQLCGGHHDLVRSLAPEVGPLPAQVVPLRSAKTVYLPQVRGPPAVESFPQSQFDPRGPPSVG